MAKKLTKVEQAMLKMKDENYTPYYCPTNGLYLLPKSLKHCPYGCKVIHDEYIESN